jgi:hypothetical protein
MLRRLSDLYGDQRSERGFELRGIAGEYAGQYPASDGRQSSEEQGVEGEELSGQFAICGSETFISL